TFAVLGERAVQSRFEAHRGQLLPMVGRDQELALLLERWSQAKMGEGQGVLLAGEAGIGKSRITRSLLDTLAGEPHIRIRYQCSPYHTDSALWPVIQQLHHAADLAGNDSTEDKLNKLEALLRSADDRAAPLIADLLGLDGAARYGPLELTPQAQRARTLAALADQLLKLAKPQPVLMILEDAHWVDPTTLELVEQYLDRIADARVLILLTSRPDNQPTLASHPHMTRLSLNRLGQSGAEAIVDRLRGETAIPPETVAAIIARTDGVPLFIEELTKAVLETGETAVPASLHDSLMARLDRLPEVKEVAQIAACIGREFDYPLLAAVVDRSEPDLRAALDRLAEAELVFRRGTTSDARYIFKHALLQDAAYQSLLKSRREDLHGRILVALEKDFVETIPEVLAAHATEGGRFENAIGYWERAGDAAYERAAHQEAVSHFRAALDLVAKIPECSRQPTEARLLIGLGSPVGTLAGFAGVETEHIYERALAVCDREANPGIAAAALDGMWRVQHDRGDERAARETAEQELMQAERHKSWSALQAAYSNLGSSALMLGDFTAARDTLRRVSQGRAPDHEGRAKFSGRDPAIYASSMEAIALWQLGMPDRALSTVQASEARGSRSPRPFDQVMPLSFVAKIRLLRREYSEARACAQRAVQLSEDKGVLHFRNDSLIWLGAALAGLGAIDQGL
ncbi:MAG: AAA family ATPase, partial [Pseudomonadota bacterium]